MASMMPALRACLRHLCAQAGNGRAVEVLKTLARLMTNAKGSDPDRHQIRLSNPALFERLMQFESAVETLEGLFSLDENIFVNRRRINDIFSLWMGIYRCRRCGESRRHLDGIPNGVPQRRYRCDVGGNRGSGDGNYGFFRQLL